MFASTTKQLSLVLFLIGLLCSSYGIGQKESSPNLVRRKRIAVASEIVLSSASIVGLNQLWYKDYPRSKFHFFNDNSQWLQMDKVGHFSSAYFLGSYNYDFLKWAGVAEDRALWYGGSSGLLYLTAIEILDGTSSEWGFSWGDQCANMLGTSLFIAQQKIWNEQRITLKFSYSNSGVAMFNESQLGRNFQQRLLKDYNAQTYWMSCNVHSFLASDAAFPRWLNVAIGYGASEMINAKMNVINVNNFQRTREFYFSFDADLNRIRWPKKWMRTTARILSIIKIPAPTIRVQSDGSVKLFALFF